MKVIIGGIYHESNTFNPFPTTIENFVVEEGENMLGRVESTEVFKSNGFEVIPSIYAATLSSGVVTEETYHYFAERILQVIKNEGEVDGIWLHLHGAMTVENIGSAELRLLKDIRSVAGEEIPISLTLDIHGNNHPDLAKYANIIRAYRTVPHTDQGETEQITAQLLIDAIRNQNKIKPAFVQVPIILSGEKALGNKEPLSSIFDKLEEVEKRKGISTASYFIGFAWADIEHSSGSVVVIPQSEEYSGLAEETANELANYIFDRRYEFKFDAIALEPDEAIERALESDLKPIFISDSGDNTTGGAVGCNTSLLDNLLSVENLNNKKICVAAIYDEEAFKQCIHYEIGEQITLQVGANFDLDSKKVELNGIVKAKGDLMGYLGCTDDKVGDVCTISVGNVDVVIANKGDSFITINHFTKAGLNIEEYDVIVVKQGYLFPELSRVSKLDILALTPGATYQLIEDLKFKHVNQSVFPLTR